ncbi:MAG: hypothetical protein H0X62_13360, partial [Bacteroidetes bacterium]|nr:hypothetical protein [Bacteroidota bacterium]
MDIKSISVGRKAGRFFVTVTGSLTIKTQIAGVGNLPAIGFQKLTIWDSGEIEIEGGALVFPEAITVKLGPATITVTAIGYGSHEQMHNGVLRKYNFFEFSGGIALNPGGVDARGDGIKFFYTTDGGVAHYYMRIAGIGLSLIIPGSASADSAALIIKGYLSLKDPEGSDPDAGTEYAGGIDFSLPKLKMAGGADMRFSPKYPAFAGDLWLELATPILLGSTGLGIYGFRALAGKNYLARKQAAGVLEEAPWWQYYKAKVAPDYAEGIKLSKFSRVPGFSIGAGVSLATVADSGKAFSSKLFFLLSLPEVFLFQGQAQVLKDRIGLDTTQDPPFFALIAISPQSIETALGVNYKIPDDKNPGSIATVDGVMEMGFFFGNSAAWYINLGRDLPENQRIKVTIFNSWEAYFYLMLSSSMIRAGAGSKYGLKKEFGPLKAELSAYFDINGRIAFKPKQNGASIQAGGKIVVSAFKFGTTLAVDAALSAEAPQPDIIYGFVTATVSFLRKEYALKFEITKQKNTQLDLAPFVLMEGASSAKGLHMLTKETYNLAFLGSSFPVSPGNWPIVPLDTYIDLEFKKGLKPAGNYGGWAGDAVYSTLVSPQKAKAEQVKHEFFVDEIKIYTYGSGSWHQYNIYEAMTPLLDSAAFDQSIIPTLKEGYWQTTEPKNYNKLRLQAMSNFDYLRQPSGSVIPPEELNITTATISCPGLVYELTCYPVAQNSGPYPVGFVFNAGQLHNVSGKYFIEVGPENGKVVEDPNNNITGLGIKNGNFIEIFLNEPSAYVSLFLSHYPPLTIKYFSKLLDGHDDNNLPIYSYNLISTSNIAQGNSTIVSINELIPSISKIEIYVEDIDPISQDLVCNIYMEMVDALHGFLYSLVLPNNVITDNYIDLISSAS